MLWLFKFKRFYLFHFLTKPLIQGTVTDRKNIDWIRGEIDIKLFFFYLHIICEALFSLCRGRCCYVTKSYKQWLHAEKEIRHTLPFSLILLMVNEKMDFYSICFVWYRKLFHIKVKPSSRTLCRRPIFIIDIYFSQWQNYSRAILMKRRFGIQLYKKMKVSKEE